MNTITISLTPDLSKFVSDLAHDTDKSEVDVVLEALSFYAEELTVQKVLNASLEPTIDAGLANLNRLLS